MSDGISKVLDVYFGKVSKVGDMAIDALKEQIDIETDTIEQELKRTTPKGETGGLLRSLTRAMVKSDKRYGYTLSYEGEDENGIPYAMIANVLNSGSSTIKPRRFVTKAIKKLKGLEERAAKRFKDKTKQ